MPDTNKYRGVVPPMITPFTADGTIDVPAARRIIDHLIAGKASGVFVLGTTGEAASIPVSEKATLVATMAEHVGGRAIKYAGISGNCFREQTDAANEYRRLGADALVAHVPYYFSLSEKEIEAYFVRLADAVPLPLILYNIPATTHHSIALGTVERLMQHANVVAIKDSAGDPQRLSDLLRLTGGRDGFPVLLGSSATYWHGLRHGAVGLVPSGAHLVPDLYEAMYNAAMAQNWPEVDRLQKETDAVVAQYLKAGSLGKGLAVLKVLLENNGLCGRTMLPPLQTFFGTTGMSDERPILGISMGDPAGIGPEIIAKALARPRVHEICRPIVVGDEGVMRNAVTFARVPVGVRAVRDVDDARFDPKTIDIYQLSDIQLDDLRLGEVSAAAGHAAFEAVRTVIDLAMNRQIDATVTAPIHKEALARAGHHFPGHTEIFAHFTQTSDYSMMLAAGDFRVVHVSTHVSLRKACDLVTRDRVLKVIELAHSACRQLGIENPKIGVAGLNPHASDGGLFGDEERQHIIPAIEAARKKGMEVEGPQPPDTFFAKGNGGAYDICVAMYHDQGHIPVKMRGFRFDAKSNTWESVKGINVSLGMPILRVSVDHGTAFDQAGKGTASDESLLDAIEYASRMSSR